MDDAEKMYYLGSVGISIRNPYKCAVYKPTIAVWSEAKYRREYMVFKVQKRLSILRWILLVIIKIITSSTILLGLLYLVGQLSQYTQSEFVGFQCGILIAMILWLNVAYLNYGIETDPNYIKFKHKGKVYG